MSLADTLHHQTTGRWVASGGPEDEPRTRHAPEGTLRSLPAESCHGPRFVSGLRNGDDDGKGFPASSVASGYRRTMERMLTIDDVADLLQMPQGWVQQQIRMDYLEGVMLDLEWRIEPDALRQFVADRRTLTPLLEAVPDTDPQ